MTLNEYVRLNADRPANSVDFLTAYANDEVFFSIDASQQLARGSLVTSQTDELKIRTAKLPDGEMALFYTSKSDDRLTEPFGGMPLHRAAEMVLGLPVLSGILVQSDGSAWLAVRKEALQPG